MSKASGLIVLLDENTFEVESLSHSLQSLGRETAVASNYQAIDNLCSDPLIQPVVISAENTPLETNSQKKQLQEMATKYLVIVALSKASLKNVAKYFRLGVADVVFPDTSVEKIKNTLQRIDQRAESRLQKRLYRTELEKANLELQESLRLLKQDQMAGLEVQKSLMPESPLKFGDYEISHSITPSLYLSGDFVGYNFVLGRYLLFYFADVSGHGASSAFVTVLLRFMIGRVIRRHQLEKDYDALGQAPEGLVEHINNQLLATGLGKHLTIVAGSLDTETSKLRYVVGAQQPSPILVTDGRAEFLPGKGKPAGIFEDASWTVQEMSLPQSFAFILLSDGVFELTPDKELADKEQTLLSYLATSSDNIDKLKQALSVDKIEDPQDDISVLLLTRGM
jgi:serine phosphatase RsbU (regulator of sigma subunit)